MFTTPLLVVTFHYRSCHGQNFLLSRSCLFFVGVDFVASLLMTTRFEWRNGAFYDISMAAEKAQRPDPCPKHTEGLKTLGVIPA